MKLNFLLVGHMALIYFLFTSYAWAHEINISHCDPDTFTNEI